jgi:hypothetical protein
LPVLAALLAVASTFWKMLVIPSLTFFPATPPTDPPAMAAVASEKACDQADPANTKTIKTLRIHSPLG